MKRVVALVTAFVMAFCLFPFSALADSASSRKLNVVVDNAPIRESPYTEGNVIQRCSKGSTLVYTRHRVNSRLNLWYEVTLSDGKTGYIYSENVSEKKERRTYLDQMYFPQLDNSTEYLKKDKCREVAKKLTKSAPLSNVVTENSLKREIYAHAVLYYTSTGVLATQFAAHMAVDKICELYPGNVCYTAEKIVDMLVDIAMPFS